MVIFVIMIALAFFTNLYYPTHLTWWAFIIALLISAAWMVNSVLSFIALIFMLKRLDLGADRNDSSDHKRPNRAKRLHRIHRELHASWKTLSNDKLQSTYPKHPLPAFPHSHSPLDVWLHVHVSRRRLLSRSQTRPLHESTSTHTLLRARHRITLGLSSASCRTLLVFREYQQHMRL
jgi:uncharacterized membrane protein